MPDLTAIRVAVALLGGLQAVASPADNSPYLAVIEKTAGAVGFFAEDGKLLAEVKVGTSRTKPCCLPMGAST